jgi:hypothetical protein
MQFELLSILVVIICLSCGGFCGWLAHEKGRDYTAWFFLGILFNLFALIAIAGAPILMGQGKNIVSNEKHLVPTEGNPWTCPNCKKTNPPNKYACEHCNYSLV